MRVLKVSPFIAAIMVLLTLVGGCSLNRPRIDHGRLAAMRTDPMATWHTPNGFLVDQNVRDQHYNMALYRAEIYRMWGARDDDESRAQFSEAVAAAADAGWIEDENTLPKRVAESSSYSQVYAGWKCINNFPVALTLTTGRMEGLTLYMREFEYYTDYGEYGEISLPDC